MQGEVVGVPPPLFFVELRLLGTDHLTCRGGYGFLFRSEYFFRTTRVRIFIFFPEFNIRLYDKNSESDFFFPPPNENIFFSNIGNQNIFLEKIP